MAWLTLVLLYATVLAGSLVRATGSGMGCPDWPRCFGRWIPPTHISQLPEDYKMRFKKPGADYVIADFNPVHTWIENLNRWIGATSGLAMFVTALLAFRRRQTDPALPWLLVGALFTFGVVSWMGSVVVHTNLKPWNITLHMLGAMLLVSVAIIAIQRIRFRRASKPVPEIGRGARTLLWLTLGAAGLQIVVGTQVREKIDHLANASDDCCRDQWAGQLGGILIGHQFGAWCLVVLVVLTWVALRPLRLPLLWALPLLLAAEYGAGVIIVKWAMPVVIQPVHLLLASFLFGLLVAALAGTRRAGRLPLQGPPADGTLLPTAPSASSHE